MKITNDKMNMGLLIGLVVVATYCCIWVALVTVGREYQESCQTLQKYLESNNTTTATIVLPPKKQLYVVYFTADWCSPCNLMKPHWRHKTVIDQLKKYRGTKSNTAGAKYKPHKIDVDLKKNQPIMKKYKVGSIPCIILMTNDGKEYGRIVGYKSQTQLRAFLSKGPVWPKAKL